MRKVNSIIVHCWASNNKDHDNIKTIRNWHIEKNKWSDVGYHYYIRKSGKVEIGRKENVRGAHAKGYNKNSIGICLGGLDVEKFTEAQFKALAELIDDIRTRHDIKNIVAHNFVANKTCPVFNIVDEIFHRLK